MSKSSGEKITLISLGYLPFIIYCIFAHLSLANDRHLTIEEKNRLINFNPEGWCQAQLFRLFDQTTSASGSDSEAESEVHEQTHSRLWNLIYTFARSTRKYDCDGLVTFCCPCIGIPLGCIFPSLGYGCCHRHCWQNCIHDCCTPTDDFNTLPIQANPWLENSVIRDALIISNPSYYQYYLSAINRSAIYGEPVLNPLTEYQLALLNYLRNERLEIIHIRADGNCFRNAILPPEDRYQQAKIDNLIRRINWILNFTEFSEYAHRDAAWTNFISNHHVKSYLDQLNLHADRFRQYLINVGTELSENSDVGLSNSNHVFAEIQLILTIPAITNEPLRVIFPNGMNETIDDLIIDTHGRRMTPDNPQFRVLAQTASILIHNGNNHYMTARSINSESNALMDLPTDIPTSSRNTANALQAEEISSLLPDLNHLQGVEVFDSQSI